MWQIGYKKTFADFSEAGTPASLEVGLPASKSWACRRLRVGFACFIGLSTNTWAHKTSSTCFTDGGEHQARARRGREKAADPGGALPAEGRRDGDRQEGERSTGSGKRGAASAGRDATLINHILFELRVTVTHSEKCVAGLSEVEIRLLRCGR